MANEKWPFWDDQKNENPHEHELLEGNFSGYRIGLNELQTTIRSTRAAIQKIREEVDGMNPQAPFQEENDEKRLNFKLI